MSLPRITATWLLAAATGTVAPTPMAHHVTNPYSCRSAHVAPYWFRGIESDACDGPLPDGSLGAEAITGLDRDGRINRRSAPVRSCTVQLNRVIHGRAYPVTGAQVTNSGRDPEYFDGRFCDAMGAWRPPRGLYNVSVTYRTANGGIVQTVQGPVTFYPGGGRG